MGHQMLNPAVRSSGASHPDTFSECLGPQPVLSLLLVPTPPHTLGSCVKLTCTVTRGSPDGLKRGVTSHSLCCCECKSILFRRLVVYCSCCGLFLNCLLSADFLFKKCLSILQQLWYLQFLLDRCHIFLILYFVLLYPGEKTPS